MTNKELTLPEGLCTFSQGALMFTRTPTQEEWEQIGRYVHAARGSSLRWMTDWRMEGRRQFGDAIVLAAEKQLEFEFKDLKASEALEKLDGSHPSAPSDAHAFVAAKLCANSYDAEEWDARRLRMVRDLLQPIAAIHRTCSAMSLEKGAE